MVPLVAALWENANFGGRKRLLVDDTSNLATQVFSDRTSAIGVHPGPDYAAWKAAHGNREPTITFYENVGYGGAALRLTTGAYANIHSLYNFGDRISSVRFNAAPEAVNPISNIPLIVELYSNANFTGNRLIVVENSSNVINDFGSEFNDVVSSVRVRQGPSFTPEKVAQLFRDPNYLGGKIDLAPGNYANIGASHGFNDVVTSIKVL